MELTQESSGCGRIFEGQKRGGTDGYAVFEYLPVSCVLKDCSGPDVVLRAGSWADNVWLIEGGARVC